MQAMRLGAASLAAVLISSTAVAVDAGMAPATAVRANGLVISEVYGGGGLPGSAYDADFVELFNPTDSDLRLDGLAVSYRTAAGVPVADPAPLTGTILAHRHFLVRMSGVHRLGAPLPAPDLVALPKQGMSARGGQVLLQSGDAPITAVGDLTGRAHVIDMVGIGGGSNSYEARPAPNTGVTLSVNRDAFGTDIDDNRRDFSLAYPSPLAMEPPGKAAAGAWAAPAATVAGLRLVQIHALVTGDSPRPTGAVEVRVDGVLSKTVPLALDGTVVTTVGPFAHAGSVTIGVRYTGDADHPAADAAPVLVVIDRATPTLTVSRKPLRVHLGGRRVRLRATVVAPGVAVTGRVRFALGRRHWDRSLQGGSARVRLPRVHHTGRKRLTVTYFGNHDLLAVSRHLRFRVRR